jgi:hypothetical protein
MGITYQYCFAVENSTMTMRGQCWHTQYCLFVIVNPNAEAIHSTTEGWSKGRRQEIASPEGENSKY